MLGVIPYIRDIGIEEEDSVALEDARYRRKATGDEASRVNDIQVAVVQLPHLSNFTDFDPLFLTPGVNPYFCQTPDELKGAHVIVLPGSKNTVEDLAWLHRAGFAEAIEQAYASGGFVFGICGGYQMLGRSVQDPDRCESDLGTVLGLALLPGFAQ